MWITITNNLLWIIFLLDILKVLITFLVTLSTERNVFIIRLNSRVDHFLLTIYSLYTSNSFLQSLIITAFNHSILFAST